MIDPDKTRTVIASLMLADHPLAIDEIADFAGLPASDVKACALYLKARGMLVHETGPDPAHSLVWKLKPNVLTYTEGLKAVPAALNYQRSKRVANRTRVARGTDPTAQAAQTVVDNAIDAHKKH